MSALQEGDLAFFFEISVDLLGIIGVDGNYKEVNPVFQKVLGYRREEILGRSLFSFVHPDDQAATQEEIDKIVSGACESVAFENRNSHHGGAWVWISWHISAARLDALLLYVIGHDITERRVVQRELEHLALYDTLTGLNNRAAFFDELNRAAARAKRSDKRFVVLYIDLDNFKPINDELGHGAGDAVLQEVGRRIAAIVREGDLAARIGGDEFTLVVEGQAVQSERAAKRLLEAIAQPYVVKGVECSLSASIGIARSDPRQKNVEQLVHYADTAMYQAKRAGGNRYCWFEEPTD